LGRGPEPAQCPDLLSAQSANIVSSSMIVLTDYFSKGTYAAVDRTRLFGVASYSQRKDSITDE
jgi:hypothetical protein